MRALIRQLRPAFMTVIVFTLFCGVAFPLLSTLIGNVAFGDKADGSLIKRDGVVVGSKLIGQTFTAPQYFHSRPSAAGAGYDGSASSGSNLGPTSPDLLAAVNDRAVAYRQENGLAADALVPVDAVTASGSGLDPHISIANARLQVHRVATRQEVHRRTATRSARRAWRQRRRVEPGPRRQRAVIVRSRIAKD
jgi:K+-transporting ATPase ATPase C chain